MLLSKTCVLDFYYVAVKLHRIVCFFTAPNTDTYSYLNRKLKIQTAEHTIFVVFSKALHNNLTDRLAISCVLCDYLTSVLTGIPQ